MESKKLSQEQIDALFSFMRRKRVPHYDVQVELVDHFASAIEDLWKEHPELPFDKAISRIYDGFPITGFYSVVSKQTEAIQKKAWRWSFTTWISYFKWPRMLFSLCLVVVLRMIFFLPINAEWLFYAVGGLLIIGGIYVVRQSNPNPKKGGMRFLRLEATYGAVGLTLNFINPLLVIGFGSQFGDLNTVPNWACWLMSVFLTYMGCFFYILFFQLPKQAKSDLRKHFPQYA